MPGDWGGKCRKNDCRRTEATALAGGDERVGCLDCDAYALLGYVFCLSVLVVAGWVYSIRLDWTLQDLDRMIVNAQKDAAEK